MACDEGMLHWDDRVEVAKHRHVGVKGPLQWWLEWSLLVVLEDASTVSYV